MVASVSLVLTMMVGAALSALSVYMIAAPQRSLAALARMGGTPLVHFGEMGLRTAAGAVMWLAAPATKFPLAIAVIGGFLIVSAVVLMLLPRRWHAAYSNWWAARIPAWAVRILAPLSLVAGGVLIWTAM